MGISRFLIENASSRETAFLVVSVAPALARPQRSTTHPQDPIRVAPSRSKGNFVLYFNQLALLSTQRIASNTHYNKTAPGHTF